MSATPYLAKARNSFVKIERAIPRHNTLAVTITAAALVLVPAGAAFAAVTTTNLASTHTTQAAVRPAVKAAKSMAKTANAATATSGKPAAAAKPAAAPVAAAPVAAVAVVADPYKTTSVSDLEATGLDGSQQTFTPSSSQWANATTIVDVAKRRGMAPYAAVIAVAVAMQESSLENLTSAVNYDSLGLFQQRPSMGWGTPAELTDPSYAANAFLSALARDVPDYADTSLWHAAQTVQESGYPTAYAQWQEQAANMVHDIAA
jgi:hypothetical protein